MVLTSWVISSKFVISDCIELWYALARDWASGKLPRPASLEPAAAVLRPRATDWATMESMMPSSLLW